MGLDEVRDGLGRAWGSLVEGWHHLRERASQALTRFHPTHGGDLQTADEQIAWEGARWGLLPAEVHESDAKLTVRLEIPGMDRDHIDVAVHDGRTLVIRGEKTVERQKNQGRYHLLECAYGHFERAVPLPVEVDDSGAQARYRRGVLSVTLPKVRATRARRIQIES